MATDAEIRLLQVLQRLDQEKFWSLPDLDRVVQELEALDWNPPGGTLDQATWNRLGRHLVKFASSQLQRILNATTPLRQDIARRVRDVTQGLNRCLRSAQEEAREALPHLLLTYFKGIDGAPQLLHFRQCCDLDSKTRFLLALAAAIRLVLDPAMLRPQMAAQPQVLILAESLESSFFTVGSDPVLTKWHDARLEGYSVVWQAAADFAVKHLKEELQDRLARAVARHAKAKAPSPEGEVPSIRLSTWPMASCPITREFFDFAHQKCLPATVGHLNVSHCPEHTLRPAVIVRLCQQLDAFNVDASTVPMQIRLSASAQVKLDGDAGLEATDSNGDTLSKEVERAPSHRTVLSFGGGASKSKTGTAVSSGSPVRELQSLGFEFAAGRGGTAGLRIAQDVQKESSGEAPKMVRRPIDWKDTKFLEQLVRLGLRAGDEEWRKSWEELCEKREVAPTFSKQKPPRQVLAEFVEVNLILTKDKEWAQPFLYKAEGQEDYAQIDLPSDEELDGNHGQPETGGESDLQVVASHSAPQTLLVGSGEASSSKPGRETLKSGDGSDVGLAKTQVEPAKSTVAHSPPMSTPLANDESKQERIRDRKERKEKKEGERTKKAKKEKRKLEGESLQAGEKSQRASKIVAEVGSSDSDSESLPKAPPSHDHKTRLCSPFLDGRCHKGHFCTAAHSQSELLKPGEAVRDYRDKLAARAKHSGQGAREQAAQPPSNRMRAWPQDKARSRPAAPSRPIMGMHPMVDHMMMGTTGPIMVVPPEMMMQVHQFHPQMAMMMDPSSYSMMHREKRSKKDGREEKDKRKKVEKEVEVVKLQPKDAKEPKLKKEKSARQKDKVRPAEKVQTARKERKVDEEDL